jgi:hypothetical protein
VFQVEASRNLRLEGKSGREKGKEKKKTRAASENF